MLARFEKLDLANLQSVADFAARLAARNHPIDLLVHCAGIAESAERRVTLDGFEMQLGVHFLGPFALTARLLPLLQRSRRPRVVQVSSLAHGEGSIHFDNLQLASGFEGRAAHFQSKLAVVMFTLELQRRSDARGWRLLSTVAHRGQRMDRGDADGESAAERVPPMLRERRHPAVFGTTVSDGALSILFAATSTTARPGGFYGPSGSLERSGPPGLARIGERARDLDASQRLWEVAEQLSGLYWPLG